MQSTQNLKKRLKSVANINKITKAMELVAATKMRRSQEIALASRPYAFAALDLLANLSLIEKSKHLPLPELLLQREVKKVLFVLVASDKGLAGSFNSSVFRKFESFLKEDSSFEALVKKDSSFEALAKKDSSFEALAKKDSSFEALAKKDGWSSVASSYAKATEDKKAMEDDSNNVNFIAVGEKASTYLSKKFSTIDRSVVLKKFVQTGDYTAPEQVEPITDFILGGYLEKKWDKVIVVSMHFKSALKQEPHVRVILPISFESIKGTLQEIIPVTGRYSDIIKIPEAESRKIDADYLIEPSPELVLEDLARHLFFMQMYHLILEANASEHSARRMAMKTASDNASELSENLTLEYNKSRQAGITNQILEISAGVEGLSLA